jgi:phosphatidylserine decarboxylase
MSLVVALTGPRKELGVKVVRRLPHRSPAPTSRLRPDLGYSPQLDRTIVTRHFSTTQRQFAASQSSSESYGSRLGKAWRNTRIQWRPIPIGLGIGFLGFMQLYRIQQREKGRQEEEDGGANGNGQPEGPGGRPKKRKKVRPSGPWTVQIMSYLPLKRVSRIWGWFNELTIPYYLRVPGFKLYSWIFGVK